ncbi:MAG: ChaN family lipoprotein [Deltaproteobacteria bacterium]|nr:ChaN family lipoprotein [Deltaproteobacteria bacterium]
MVLSPREELVRLQKKIYRANRAIIEQSVVVQEPDFDNYARRYRHAVAHFQRAVSHETMLKAVQRADIVYVGDYHTCPQSQRSFLRILKAIRPRQSRPLLLGLELFHRRHQPTVDAFLAGSLSEQSFLQTVGLRQHWVFDLWDHFRPIFDFARYHRIPILGIDAAARKASLMERDQQTGAWIATLAERYPAHQLFILIGDLHLAPQHLPLETEKVLKARHLERADLILYQNSEPIYWSLARRGREQRVGVVQIDRRTYCRMHTPPIICQQSYLNWLDHEEGAIDYADAKEQFLHLVQQMAHFLRIPLGQEMENITVYTCGDLSFLHELRRRRRFSPRELKTIRRHVLAAESYCLPQERMVYLANLSVNHAAEEASHYLKFLCSGPEHPRPLIDAFYANLLHEALGFFGSKLINHHRKCFHDADFFRRLAYFRRHGIPPGREGEFETAQLVVTYRRYERRGKPLQYKAIFQQSADRFFSVTHALGYMLGDRMFYGVMGRKIPRALVRRLFTEQWWFEGQAFEWVADLQERLRTVSIPARM